MENCLLKLPLLHKNQLHILKNAKRFNVVCCGRRFGKDVMLEDLIIRAALEGLKVGLTAPTFKMSSTNKKSLLVKLAPILKKKSGSENQIILKTGGIIDFWSLENFESMRGRRYHLHVTNEASIFRHLKQAWTEVIRPTLIDYRGVGWFFATPKGTNYFKEIYEKGVRSRGVWKSFHFTSYDNPKLNKEELKETVKDMPELIYRQEIMAEFVDGTGTLLKSTDIKYYDDLPDGEYDTVVGVDLAISQKQSADYTAIVVLKKNKTTGNIYIENVIRDRITFTQILAQIKSVYNRYRPYIIGIEQVSFQAAIVQELIRTTSLPIKPIIPDRDKVTRFQPILARFEQGLVYINSNIINDFQKELLSFPLGKHDDMVDATAHAFNLLEKPKAGFCFSSEN